MSIRLVSLFIFTIVFSILQVGSYMLEWENYWSLSQFISTGAMRRPHYSRMHWWPHSRNRPGSNFSIWSCHRCQGGSAGRLCQGHPQVWKCKEKIFGRHNPEKYDVHRCPQEQQKVSGISASCIWPQRKWDSHFFFHLSTQCFLIFSS